MLDLIDEFMPRCYNLAVMVISAVIGALSYDQLIELARLLRQEVQRIVFYGTYLEKLAQAATSLEELDAIVWDYGAASASGIIDRLLAGGAA